MYRPTIKKDLKTETQHIFICCAFRYIHQYNYYALTLCTITMLKSDRIRYQNVIILRLLDTKNITHWKIQSFYSCKMSNLCIALYFKFKFKFKFNEISSEAGQLASIPGYTIVSRNTYDITITLNTSGSKWTGSIIIYEFMHGPKFI